jgi:bifunctional DNA-binding transcriptional regulator/antitoxin component of YhaV-PrlF toxin-antitoxin module
MRVYAEFTMGDLLEFVILSGSRVMLGRAAPGSGRPIRPTGVLTSSGVVTIPLAVQRHMQIEPGDDVQFLRIQGGSLGLEKTDQPRHRGRGPGRDSLGDRGAGRGLDMLVSISVPED